MAVAAVPLLRRDVAARRRRGDEERVDVEAEVLAMLFVRTMMLLGIVIAGTGLQEALVVDVWQ